MKSVYADSINAGLPLLQVEAVWPMPGYVKEAATSELSQLPDDHQLYASHAPRDFPCHTKTACWLSTALYGLHRDQFSTAQQEMIEHRLRKFAQQFDLPEVANILDDAKRLRVKEAAISKVAYTPPAPPDTISVLGESFPFSALEHLPEETREFLQPVNKLARCQDVSATIETLPRTQQIQVREFLRRAPVNQTPHVDRATAAK